MNKKMLWLGVVVFFVICAFLFVSKLELNANENSDNWQLQWVSCADTFPNLCPNGGGCSVRLGEGYASFCTIHMCFSVSNGIWRTWDEFCYMQGGEITWDWMSLVHFIGSFSSIIGLILMLCL